MAFFKWSDKLSVDVPEMDEQHKKLIGMIDELHDAMKKKHGTDIVGKIINDMINYTAIHFSSEEKLMERGNFPELARHMSIHEEFIDKVNGFRHDLSRGRLLLSMEVMNFLLDWLSNHIQKTDKKYGEYFARNRLAVK